MDSFLKKISKYKYPTLEELSKIQNEQKVPGLHRFGFKDQWNIEEIQNNLINGNTLKYNQLSHLYEWDKLLEDKIVDIQLAYVYVLVHFNRGLPRTAKEYIENTDSQHNYENIRFYFTYLHYIIISIIDNILQIINVYFDLGKEENQIYKDKIIEELRRKGFYNVADYINGFYDDFARYSNFRNALAHRFSPLSIDRRSILDEKLPDRKITLGGNNDFPDFEAEILSVEDSFSYLRSFMKKLRKEMNL